MNTDVRVVEKAKCFNPNAKLLKDDRTEVKSGGQRFFLPAAMVKWHSPVSPADVAAFFVDIIDREPPMLFWLFVR